MINITIKLIKAACRLQIEDINDYVTTSELVDEKRDLTSKRQKLLEIIKELATLTELTDEQKSDYFKRLKLTDREILDCLDHLTMTNFNLITKALEIELEDLKDSLKLETDQTQIQLLESQQSLCETHALQFDLLRLCVSYKANDLDDVLANQFSEEFFSLSLIELREMF